MSRTVASLTTTENLNITGATVVNGGILTFPTSTTTLVGRDTNDTLTNKIFESPTMSTINNGGILTLPTSTTTLVGRDTNDTLTNKTLTGATNTIEASGLRNGSTWSVGMTGAAPTPNQALIYNGTNAEWISLPENVTSANQTTTGATAATLETIATTTNRGLFIQSIITARRSDTGNTVAGFKLNAMIQNVADTVTQVDTTDLLSFAAATGYAVSIEISGTNALIRVTGAEADTVQWRSQTTTVPTN